MVSLLALLLTASVDGQAALRHASALAALGPHPWGSTRNEAAALYVAAQMRTAGLSEVELQRFERNGTQGTNVIGTLRAPGDEWFLIGAHHDTAPGAPGAYDDAGGVGILLELARVLASEGARARTIVFASFDGEEAWAKGDGTTAGSRAYLERVGSGVRSMVAAFVIEMSGWSGGTPVLHPIAYADPRRPGRTVVAPAWLVRAALAGSRAADAPLGLGDPYLSWLYQPAVRSFRVRLYGDDLPFVQAGHPALFASDSSFSAFYPDYHEASDRAERLDADALGRMARAALGVARSLDRVPRGPEEEACWFAAFGRVIDWRWLLGLGALSVLPGLRAALLAGGAALPLRLIEVVLFGVLLWTEPVTALWLFLLPHLLPSLARGRWTALLSLSPTLALLVIGAAAWWRGVVSGVWLAPWQIAAALLALVLALFVPALRPAGRGDRGSSRKQRRAGGLPKPHGR